jgi:hypothetical protein
VLLVTLILLVAPRWGEPVWARQNDRGNFFAFSTYAAANLLDSCTL